LTSHTPGGRRPETVAASVLDRLAFPFRLRSGGVGFGRRGGEREGSDLRETVDTNDRGRGLGGIKTHGRNVHPSLETGAGAWTRRRSNALKSTGPACVATRAPGGPPSRGFGRGTGGEQRQEGNGRGDAVRLPARSKPSKGHRCEDPVGSPLRGGSRPAARRGCLVHPSSGERETQRTPCPVPGCNKPGPCGAEKTAEVVRNHGGGTRCHGVAAMVRWSAFGRFGSGPPQAPEKGTSKDRVRGRKDRVVLDVRLRATSVRWSRSSRAR
jgi:hypothetical protein